MADGAKISQTLYKLKGRVSGNVRQAFVSVNATTQLVDVLNGAFETDIALCKGNNKISVAAFDFSGAVGRYDTKLVFTPPAGAPVVKLETPANGEQGIKQGDAVIVSGTIKNAFTNKAILLLNGVSLDLPVEDGRFEKTIYMPNTKITTFRVMAQNRGTHPGYSALHTVLSGHEIDLINPKPF